MVQQLERALRRRQQRRRVVVGRFAAGRRLRLGRNVRLESAPAGVAAPSSGRTARRVPTPAAGHPAAALRQRGCSHVRPQLHAILRRIGGARPRYRIRTELRFCRISRRCLTRILPFRPLFLRWKRQLRLLQQQQWMPAATTATTPSSSTRTTTSASTTGLSAGLTSCGSPTIRID